jgi:hypothetical protein
VRRLGLIDLDFFEATMAKRMNDAIEIRRREYASGHTIWNVWRGGKIINRLVSSEAADEYVANRWYKISDEDQLRAARVALSNGSDARVRYLNVKLAEIEAKERPH